MLTLGCSNDFYEDYSYYSGRIVATPQKSLVPSVPVATVGGEPGGRGAIVVPNPAAIAPEPEASSVVIGKVEPGYDVFGAGKEEGVSISVGQKLDQEMKGGEEKEEKEISSVGGGSLTTSDTSTAATSESTTEISKSPTNANADMKANSESKKAEGTAEDKTATTAGDAKKEDEKKAGAEKGKAAGPMDELDMEAAKVAQELYPDALGDLD